MNDYLYADPPLIEVIAEIHWKLEKLSSIPDGQVDPLFSKFLPSFKKHSSLAKLSFEERLLPDEVPLELFGHKPVFRFRPTANGWPIYQVGPGVFVVNVAPPYKGWKEFRSILADGIRALFESYPASDRVLEISSLELRYVDAFKKRHGMEIYPTFLETALSMKVQLPPQLAEESIDGGLAGAQMTSRFSFPCKKMAGSRGRISIGLGTADGESAALLQMAVRMSGSSVQTNEVPVLAWFDNAHQEVRRWFELVTTEAVRRKFGEKTTI